MRIHPTTEIPTTNLSPPDPVLHAEYRKEKTWQKAVERMLKQGNFRVQHFWDSMNARAGWPDIFAWHPSGAAAFIELKTETGRLTEAQRVTLRELAAIGVPTYLIRPSDVDELVAVIAAAMERREAA